MKGLGFRVLGLRTVGVLGAWDVGGFGLQGSVLKGFRVYCLGFRALG